MAWDAFMFYDRTLLQHLQSSLTGLRFPDRTASPPALPTRQDGEMEGCPMKVATVTIA